MWRLKMWQLKPMVTINLAMKTYDDQNFGYQTPIATERQFNHHKV